MHTTNTIQDSLQMQGGGRRKGRSLRDCREGTGGSNSALVRTEKGCNEPKDVGIYQLAR